MLQVAAHLLIDLNSFGRERCTLSNGARIGIAIAARKCPTFVRSLFSHPRVVVAVIVLFGLLRTMRARAARRQNLTYVNTAAVAGSVPPPYSQGGYPPQNGYYPNQAAGYNPSYYPPQFPPNTYNGQAQYGSVCLMFHSSAVIRGSVLTPRTASAASAGHLPRLCASGRSTSWPLPGVCTSVWSSSGAQAARIMKGSSCAMFFAGERCVVVSETDISHHTYLYLITLCVRSPSSLSSGHSKLSGHHPRERERRLVSVIMSS